MKSTIYMLFLLICSVGLISCSPSLQPGAELSGHDLSNQQLTNIDLTGANLSNANLTGANLIAANLSTANLSGANLSNANLTQANLIAVNLTSANLTGAILDGADLSDAQGVTDELLSSATSAVGTRRDSLLTITNTMAPVCQGNAVAQAAAFTGGTGVHPVIYITDNPSYDTPVRWSPLAIGETQLVACIGQSQMRQIESCQYTAQGGGAAPSITRYQNVLEVHLVAAQTGETIAVVNVEGQEPDECPSTAALNATRIEGISLHGSDIKGALTAYVAPTQLQTLAAGRIMDLRWSSEGNQLATLDRDGVIAIWDVTSGTTVSSESSGIVLVRTDFIADSALSPDWQMVIGGGASTHVSFWNGDTPHILLPNNGFAFAWSADGVWMASSIDANVIIWEAVTQQEQSRFSIVTNDRVFSLAWSPDGTHLAGGSGGERIYVWNTTTDEQIALFEPSLGSIDYVAWSPDGTRLASGNYQGVVHVWDISTGQIVLTLEGESGSSSNVLWSPDGTILATTMFSSLEVRLWDASTGTLLAVLDLAAEPGDIAWSPDGTTLAIQVFDNSIVLWRPTL
jgi:WD40 repeat protein